VEGKKEEVRWVQVAEGKWRRISRREFLKIAGVGVAAASLGPFIFTEKSVGATAPPRGGRLVVLVHHSVYSLSPHDRGYVIRTAVAQIHNALLEINHNLEVEPVLAKDFTISRDGLVWTFNLRQGVRFHDGVEFTSRDVKYTFEWHLDPKNASAWADIFSAIDRIETPNKYQVVIRFKYPDARFLRFGATYPIVPAHYHSQVGEDKYKTAPIGTGPFKLKEWRAAEYTLLEAFPQHFRGRPKVDEFMLRVVPEASVRALALQTGDAHSSFWNLHPLDNERFSRDPNFIVFRTVDLTLNQFSLNNKRPQLSDRRVRQAMMYAIDRERMVREIFRGQAVVATANISPTVKFYYEPNVKKYTYDPQRANQLLDEAGWTRGADGIREKAGQKLQFTTYVISGDQVRKPQAEFVQQALREVGIRMEIREAPWATIYERLLRGEIDSALFNWTHGGFDGEPDATDTLSCKGGTNFHQFCRTRVDQLLAAGARELDPERRRRYYSEIQKIVAEEVPMLYMTYWEWFQIFSRKVQGLPREALFGPRLYRLAWQWSLMR